MILIKSRMSRAISLAEKRLQKLGFSVERLNGRPFHLQADLPPLQRKIRICLDKIELEEKKMIIEKYEHPGIKREIWLKQKNSQEFEIFFICQ